MKLFDTHAHVNDGRFDNDRDEMLQACFDAGVEYIMIPGVDRGTVESGLALAKQYDRLYAAVGTHPHESKDFTEQEQKQIEKGLSTAEISDKEAAKKLLALVPQEWLKRIPFFVRGHATTKTVERVAKQYPELYAVAKRQGDLPEKEREELRKIMTDIFEEKMNKHKIK